MPALYSYHPKDKIHKAVSDTRWQYLQVLQLPALWGGAKNDAPQQLSRRGEMITKLNHILSMIGQLTYYLRYDWRKLPIKERGVWRVRMW